MDQNSSATTRDPHVQMDRSEIMPGDHIYTPRGGVVPFDHHGICIGKEEVIHFQKSVEDLPLRSGSSSGSLPCSVCGQHRKKDRVVKSCLDCFLRNGKIYRYEYGYPFPYAPLKMVKAGLMKWSTSFVSDHPETVIDRAKDLLEKKDGFGDYSLIEHNCEDFALYCKTGKLIRSGQVVLAFVVPLMILKCVYSPFALSSIDWQDYRLGYGSGDDFDEEEFPSVVDYDYEDLRIWILDDFPVNDNSDDEDFGFGDD